MEDREGFRMSGLVADPPVADARTARVARATAIALDQPPRRVAAALFAVIAVLCGLGALERLGADGFSLFDFDGEGKPLAIWSALVLFAAGGLALLTAWVERDDRRAWAALGAFFVFMGLDEGLTVHELMSDHLHTSWIYLYLPVAAVGGVAWLLVVRRIWPLARERTLLIAGAAAWFFAQVLEVLEWDGPRQVDGYGALSGIEETLEVSGSALFVLAMLGALRAVAQARE
jgi:hypothetical protein